MDNMKHRRLQELDRSDFEIVDGEPDIRGWDVKNSSGQKVGEVEELIVDAQQKKVRYMVVDLEDGELELGDKEVLIPIGLAELDKEEDDVILRHITLEQLRELPGYDDDRLNPAVERQICTVLGRKAGAGMNTSGELDPEFYRHEYFNDDNLYKNRLHEARPVKSEQQSEYERGLRLWEKRSEGGIIPHDSDRGSSRRQEDRTISEEARMEMVRNRRKDYEQRKRGGLGRDQDRSGRRSNSIEDRIRNEGLRDA